MHIAVDPIIETTYVRYHVVRYHASLWFDKVNIYLAIRAGRVSSSSVGNTETLSIQSCLRYKPKYVVRRLTRRKKENWRRYNASFKRQEWINVFAQLTNLWEGKERITSEENHRNNIETDYEKLHTYWKKIILHFDPKSPGTTKKGVYTLSSPPTPDLLLNQWP